MIVAVFSVLALVLSFATLSVASFVLQTAKTLEIRVLELTKIVLNSRGDYLKIVDGLDALRAEIERGNLTFVNVLDSIKKLVVARRFN